MKKIVISAILAMTFVNLTAQVLTRSTDRQTVDASIKLKEITSLKTFNLPEFNIEKLLAEDIKDRADGVPFRFGHIFDISLSMENSGEWDELPEGKVWSLKISSAAAHSINLVYDRFFLPKGSWLYLYNSDKTILQGPITSEHNTHSGQFATDLIPGSEIILEYFEPYGIEEKCVISISKAVHGYINLFYNTLKGFGSSESCNIDINCPQGEDWGEESNAVAMIIVGSNRICSGALVNNACHDFTPYFLTANHCVQNQNVGNWIFRFDYKSPTCGGGDAYSYHSYYGSTLRANAEVSDFALLELNQRPLENTGITYAGWSRNVNSPISSVGIHHPSGDVMKISIENDTAESVAWEGGQSDTHWRVNFDSGVVEHGSSGSPLFNQNSLIVGQLHGNQNFKSYLSYCEQPTGEYGRFDVSWNNGLATWLDPNSTNLMTTNTITIPYISGPTTVCSSSTTFTLNNLPAGCTVTWTKSSNLAYVGGQGTSYTVKALSPTTSGLGWVQASVSGACGAVLVPRKYVWVGVPAQPAEIGGFNYNGMQFGSESVYEFWVYPPVIQEVNSYTWVVAGGSIISGQGTNRITVLTGRGSDAVPLFFDVNVRVGNPCGLSPWLWRTGYVVGGTGALTSFSLFPNPTTDMVTIVAVEGNSSALTANDHTNEIHSVKIFDKMGMAVGSYNFSGQESQVNVNVSSLQKGVYLILINEKNRITLIKE